MEILGLAVFYIVMATGAIMILFGLPGTWVLWIAVALYSFIADFNTTDWHVVILAFIIGGIIGAVTGFPIFLIGSILGMLAGVFLGAFIWEWVSSREVLLSLRKAMAATFSRIVSVFAKI